MPARSRSNTMPTVVQTKSSMASKTSPSSGMALRVGFPKDPVSSVSRPVDNRESWAAYDFEMHARKCACCTNPYEVHRQHRQLCDLGHRLAQQVAKYLYSNAKGETYSTTEEDNALVRVEMPSEYYEVRGLLKAIDRSIRHRSRSPFISSMDRTYYVQARTPQRSHSVKIEQPKSKPRIRSGEIMEWPSTPAPASPPKPVAKVYAEVNNSTSSNVSRRGSLYVQDQETQRRNAKHYLVEVRQPAHRLSGYHR